MSYTKTVGIPRFSNCEPSMALTRKGLSAVPVCPILLSVLLFCQPCLSLYSHYTLTPTKTLFTSFATNKPEKNENKMCKNIRLKKIKNIFFFKTFFINFF